MSTTHSHSPQAPRQARKKVGSKGHHSHKSPGWVPNQHGAWFMVTVPPLVGLILAPSWAAIPILLTWWFGYFTFFAATVWLRGRMRKRHLPPVLVYGTLTAVAGLATLFTCWPLLTWAFLYAPLVAVAVYETWKRRPRSLASGWSTVLAAVLMTPTVVSVSPSTEMLARGVTPGSVWAGTSAAWGLACIFALYFGGTIFYVKTLIRDFGNRARLIESILFHAMCAVAGVVVAIVYPYTWPVAVVSVVILFRAWALPRFALRTGKRISPAIVGGLDAVITVAVVAAGLAALHW